MYRLMVVSAVIAIVVSQELATGQESTRADFDEYCKAMVGTWQGNVTLVQDMPGLGKKGDQFKVRGVNKLASNGTAIVGKGEDGKGGVVSLTYYDADAKQILGVVVFASGAVNSAIVSKQAGNKWTAIITLVMPDGKKTETKSTLVITDNGDTHTWTSEGNSDVWRRVQKQ